MFKLNKKRVAIGVGAAAIVVAAPFAYSYWTEEGSGNGSAATGTTEPITVNQDTFDAIEDALYPGGAPVELSGDFDNENDGPVYIDHVTVEVDPTWSSDLVDVSLPECDAEDFAIDGTATVTDEIEVGAGQGEWSGLTIQLVNSDDNQDNCKDVTVPLVYTAHAFPAGG